MKDTKKKAEHAIGQANEAASANVQPIPASAPSAAGQPKKPILGSGELIIGILAVILICAAAYTFLQQAPVQPPPQQQPASANASEAFISSLYKMRNIGGYEMSYLETDGPMETQIFLQSNGTQQYGRFDSILDSREFYFDGANTVLCNDYKGRQCYLVATNGSIFDNYAQSIEAKFIESAAVSSALRTNEKLVQVGAIKFDKAVGRGVIAGRNCTSVSYSINYGGLSINQLRDLGIQPDDPSITSFSSFRTEQCMDDKFGIALRVSLSYSELGKERTFGTLYTSFNDAFSHAVSAPPESASAYVSEMQFAQQFNAAQKAIRAAYLCISNDSTATEQDACFRTLAYSSDDSRVCGHVKDPLARDQCYLAIAQTDLSAIGCLFAGSLKDDCYVAVAGGTGDASICDEVTNATLLAACNAAVEDAHSKGIYPKKPEPVCATDSDCAAAGCNKELCVPVNITGSVNTACDPTLTCYKALANCTCNAGACDWKKKDGFAACLEEWETANTKKIIEPLINSTMNITANATANATNKSG
jgi:hypothetical protein